MTLAHELGHTIMHNGPSNFRHSGATGSTGLGRIGAYQSAEHQAKVFASAFLIHDDQAAQMRDAQEISVEFGVSLQAAQLSFDRLARIADQRRSAERIRKTADETIALLSGKKPSKPAYLDDPCGSCHQVTLIPMGIKVLCDTCGFIGDRFQDGDEQA
jgi:Zn-dependent peptidase ImmA (M78 family)